MRRTSAAVTVLLCVLVFESSETHALAAQPALTLSATSGSAGTDLTIKGANFPANETVALYIDQPGPYMYVQGVKPPGPVVDAQGNFSITTKWPDRHYDTTGTVNPTTPGAHSVCADTNYPNSAQPVQAKACTYFTVLAVPSPSPSPHAASPVPTGVPLPILGGALLLVLGLGLAGWLLLQRTSGSASG